MPIDAFAKAATIKALMIRRTIKFSKPAELVEWKNPKADFVSFKDGKVVVKITSPSQTSIDFGEAVFEVRDKEGLVLARLTGGFKVEKEESFHEFEMAMTPELEVNGYG